MFIKIYLCIALLNFNNGTAPEKDTVITGEARNAKAGAIVMTDKDFYFVDGLSHWEDKYYGKKVKVTGRLILEINPEHKKEKEAKDKKQEIKGTIKIIKKPEWILLE